MALPVTFRDPLWRWILTELDGTVVTWLDKLASNRAITYILNGSAIATCEVPSDNPEVNRIWDAAGTLFDDEPYVSEGTRHLIGFRREIEGGEPFWNPRYGGTILQLEDVAESEVAKTRMTAYDPWQLLYSRPIRNGAGGLPGQDGLSFTATKANVVAATLLKNTITEDGTLWLDAGTTYGGTSFYDGDFEDCPLIDINFQQGQMVGEAWDTLCSMAQIDIILSPLWDPDNRPGYIAQMNTYPLAGEQKPSALFGWDKPTRSLVGITNLHDGTIRSNAVQYYESMGGDPVTLAEDTLSQGRYGVYFAQQFWPGLNIPVGIEAMAEHEVALRANGQHTVTLSPAPERAPSPFTEYFLGDQVKVNTSNRMREALTGYQRVYGIPIEISDDSLETVRQILASPQTGAF